MYVSAKQLLEAGLEGKWVKVSKEEQEAIIDSIAGENLIRGTKGQPSLRHHVHGNHIEVHSSASQAESSEPKQ